MCGNFIFYIVGSTVMEVDELELKSPITQDARTCICQHNKFTVTSLNFELWVKRVLGHAAIPLIILSGRIGLQKCAQFASYACRVFNVLAQNSRYIALPL